LTAILVGAMACGPADPDGGDPVETLVLDHGEIRERYTGDFAEILARGSLRVLVESEDDRPLPRRGDPVERERELATAFAQRHGIDVHFVPMDTFAALLPALEAGIGDVVAANLTATPQRREKFAFSLALDLASEVLVLRAGDTVPGPDAELRGRIGIRAGTTFDDTARDLASRHDQLEVVVFPGSDTAESVLDSLVAGAIDFAIEDDNRLEVFLGYREDVQAGPPLTIQRPLAWAVRPTNPRLLEELNAFLHEQRLLGGTAEPGVADLPQLKERGRIRMITRNNAATYFLWRGEVLGFEYELAHRFAEHHDLRLEVVVAPTHDDLLPMLLAGEGDFVAAFLTATPEREEEGVKFSRPYHFASEVVVGRGSEKPMGSVADLSGRRIAVRRSSAYWSTLAQTRERFDVRFEVVEVPANMETEAIMVAVADSVYDLTVADSHLLELEMTIRDDLQGLLQLSETEPHGWAVHPDNTELLAAIDEFIERNYRGLFYNVTYQKYFERAQKYELGWENSGAATRLSPYDELVRNLAAGTRWDWRLVVAQMYQESRFDPGARSWAGARGLMQVLPRTARELGITDLSDPREGIRAGIEYLDWVWDRFPNELDPAEHMWFTLAGYNAGHGHVRDARRLAKQLNLDPDKWFDNVEVAMLKLSQQEYARQARHGFVRGREPVNYVRQIRERYRAYVNLLESENSGR
jgi:membrane-bound lytic murein transglycosylase F